jgi:hypothetical protein
LKIEKCKLVEAEDEEAGGAPVCNRFAAGIARGQAGKPTPSQRSAREWELKIGN